MVVKVGGKLRIVYVEGSREMPFTFEADEIRFAEVPTSIQGKGRSFMWAKKLKHLHGGDNIYVMITESSFEGSIDNVQITLRDCEILEFPRFSLMSNEDAK